MFTSPYLSFILFFTLFFSGCISNTTSLYKDIDNSQNKKFNSNNYKEIIKSLKPIKMIEMHFMLTIFSTYSFNDNDNIINFDEYKSYFKLFSFINNEKPIYISSVRLHEFLPNPFVGRSYEIVFPKIVILDKEGNIIKPKITKVKKDNNRISFKISGFPKKHTIYYLLLASENFKKIPTIKLTNSSVYKNNHVSDVFSAGVSILANHLDNTINFKVLPSGGTIYVYQKDE
jgi:hypothetical protein